MLLKSRKIIENKEDGSETWRFEEATRSETIQAHIVVITSILVAILVIGSTYTKWADKVAEEKTVARQEVKAEIKAEILNELKK